MFHPSPLLRANELGETRNRDSPSSRFYFVTTNSLVRLASSAPAYYQVELVFFSKLSWGVRSCLRCPSLICGVPTVVGLLREPPHPSQFQLSFTIPAWFQSGLFKLAIYMHFNLKCPKEIMEVKTYYTYNYTAGNKNGPSPKWKNIKLLMVLTINL